MVLDLAGHSTMAAGKCCDSILVPAQVQGQPCCRRKKLLAAATWRFSGKTPAASELPGSEQKLLCEENVGPIRAGPGLSNQGPS